MVGSFGGFGGFEPPVPRFWLNHVKPYQSMLEQHMVWYMLIMTYLLFSYVLILTNHVELLSVGWTLGNRTVLFLKATFI